METLNKIIGGNSVVAAYSGMTCKVKNGPSVKDLTDPEYLAFLDSVMRDALGEDYENVA